MTTIDSITQNTINNMANWPYIIKKSGIYYFADDLVFSSPKHYFIIETSDVTIDGYNYLLTIKDIPDYHGLIQNGIPDDENGNNSGKAYGNIVIQNIGISSNNSFLSVNQGWICQNYFGNRVSTNITISNCYSTGNISKYCGGICGSHFGYQMSGNGTIQNCYSTGSIDEYSGGICSYNFGSYTSGTVTIEKCYSTGNIKKNGGGICSSGFGFVTYGTVMIQNCYSLGNIGDNGGGICSSDFASATFGTAIIQNCYSVGSIGDNGGGICGSYFGNSCLGTAIIKNCYSIGSVGLDGGGVCGSSFGNGLSGTAIVKNCYSIGSVGLGGGGICGSNFGPDITRDANVIFENCTFFGNNWEGKNPFYLSSKTYNLVNNQNSGWKNSLADSTMTGINDVWYKFVSQIEQPYLLASFNKDLYSPNKVYYNTGQINISNAAIPRLNPTQDYFTIMSANDNSILSSVSIQSLTGQLTFVNLSGYYYIRVLGGYKTNLGIYFGYDISNYIYYTDIEITKDNINNYSWPLKIYEKTNVTFKDNLVFNSPNHYFIINGSDIKINGQNNTVTIDNSIDYNGLIQNGTKNENGYGNIEIQDIGVLLNYSTLASNAGWICQKYFGSGISTNITISNCYSTGLIRDSCGGICGSNFGYKMSGTATIQNCYSSGGLGHSSGGICGPSLGDNMSGTINIKNCYSTGDIFPQGGGICGPNFGYQMSGTLIIENCYSLGSIFNNGGGICGSYFGSQMTGIATIQNCYSISNVGENGGGICGSNFGYLMTGTATIQNCYSTGSVGSNGGGICGSYFGDNMSGTATVKNCYSIGSIGIDGGGICGSNFGYLMTGTANVIIQNSTFYSTNWYGSNSQNLPLNTSNLMNNKNSGWVNSLADSTMTGINSVWYKFHNVSGQIDKPYLLASYNRELYSPNKKHHIIGQLTTTNTAITISNSTQAYFTIMAVNDNNILSGMNIVSLNGQLIFDYLVKPLSGHHNIRVVGGYKTNFGVYYGYNISNYMSYIDIEITNNNINNYSWPLKIYDKTTVTFAENLVFNSPNHYFIISGSNVKINGQNHNVTIDNITNYNGLIQNGTEYENGYENIEIQNIGILSNNSSLATNNGWICQNYFGNRILTNITISNCYSTGDITYNGGGICGFGFGYNMSGTAIIQNCFSSGYIRNYAGGICGTNFGNNMSGTATIQNCYSVGDIGNYSGGICGPSLGSSMSGTINIKNCYSTGNIQFEGGGICGSYFGYKMSGTSVIENCYSTGNIKSEGGGICGSYFGYQMAGTSNVTIKRCYTTGTVLTENMGEGGIVGSYFGNQMAGNAIITLERCAFYGQNWYGSNSQNLPTISDRNNLNNNQNNGWKNELADYIMTGTNTIWYKFYDELGQKDKPYLLASFNNNLYYPNTGEYFNGNIGTSNDAISRYNLGNIVFTIMDVNNSYLLSDIYIKNSSTGKLEFNNINNSLSGKYNIKVIGGNINNSGFYFGYDISNHTANFSLSKIIEINNKTINSFSWPFTINTGTTIIFTEHLTFNSPNHFFIIGGSDITIDGQNFTINIYEYITYPGLIQNGTQNTNGYGNIEVKNIGMLPNLSTLVENQGWICQSYFGNGTSSDITISNCYSTGNIIDFGGGICGSNFGYNMSGTAIIQNCYSIGIIGNSAGGISGSNFVSNMLGKAVIQNCYSIGTIGNSAGGISGSNFGFNMSSGTAIIQNCYTIGNIEDFGGGICGKSFGNRMIGNATIKNCYSTGMVKSGGGGIFGNFFGLLMTGKVNIEQCTFYGQNWYGSDSQNLPSSTTNLLNNKNSGWQNSLADSTIIGLNTIWYKFYENEEKNAPYLLASFNNQLYYPNSNNYTSGQTIYSNDALQRNDIRNDFFNIMAINNNNIPSGITIDKSTGNLKFENLISPSLGKYNIRVVGGYLTVLGGFFYGYDISNYMVNFTINKNIEITQENIDNYSWPLIIDSGMVVTFLGNLTFNSINHYFIIGGPDVQIDGKYYTVTIDNITGYSGLIQNGTYNKNGYGNVQIKNIGVLSKNSKLGNNKGWICQEYFGNGISTNISISNCYSNGFMGGNGGGICGAYFGKNMQQSSNAIIQNCYSTGNISGNSGGICGAYLGYYTEGTVIIQNCYSTGVISINSGGICGPFFGYRMKGSATIQNCYTTGNIQNNSGGICGAYFGSEITGFTKITIRRCYTSGVIVNSGGGICGSYFGFKMTAYPEINIFRSTFYGDAWYGSNSEFTSSVITEYLKTGQNNGWKNILADSIESGFITSITGAEAIWYKSYNNNGEIDKPYLLASFNQELYSPNNRYYKSAENGFSSDAIPKQNSTIDTFNIIAVDNGNIPYGMTIESATGKLIFNNMTSPLSSKYNIRVIRSYQNDVGVYYGYDIGNYQYYTDITISKTNILNYYWPLIIDKEITVTFIDDLVLNSEKHYFIIKSSGVKINGQNKTVTIDNVKDYPGLFQNGSENENGYGNIEIKNIGVLSLNDSTLADNEGWICQKYFGNSISTNIKISKCYSVGNVGNNGGGICGYGFGYNMSGIATIENCYSIGNVGNYGGGICGSYFGKNMRGPINATIQNCYSIGDIGNNGGGICGSNFGYQMFGTDNENPDGSNAYATIKNCYTTGSIGENGGGICGSYFASQLATKAINTIQNCYSTGIVGNGGGGICGSYFADQIVGIAILEKCTFYGGNFYGNNVNISYNIQTTQLVSEKNNGWQNSLADSASGLTDINNIWYKFYQDKEINKPYLLSAFNNELYLENSGEYIFAELGTSNDAISRSDSANDSFTIMSANNNVIPSYITINETTGKLTFNNPPTNSLRKYIIRIVGGYRNVSGVYYQYDISNYTSNFKYENPIKLTQANISKYSWPLIINTGITVIFTENLTFNSKNHYFIINGSDIIIDGGNKTITIDGISDYFGLIKNGTENENGYGNIEIKNIGILSNNSTILYRGGWICQAFFGKGVLLQNITISNCYSNGFIGTGVGGICGDYFGRNMSGNITIQDCYSTGDGGGGICSSYFGYQMSGIATIKNCYSSGNIYENGGGICGFQLGYQMSGTITLKNCYSTGEISIYGGGICGSSLGYELIGTIIIQNCYSTGVRWEEFFGGGICGSSFGINMAQSAKVTIQNCTFYGKNWYGRNSQNIPSDTLNLVSDQNSGWLNSLADSTLTDITSANTIWYKFYDNSGELNKPYLLSSFNNQLYSPNIGKYISGEITTTNNAIIYSNSSNYVFTIMSVKNTIIPSNITIELSSGKLTFDNRTKSLQGTFNIKVVGGYQNNSGVYYGYQISNYTYIVAIEINQKTVDNNNLWPFIINEKQDVIFTENLRFNSENRYFVVKNSDVTFDGKNNIINIDNVVHYLGLIQNGTKTTVGYGNIKIKNIGVLSSNNPSLINNGGWICHSYFGNFASGDIEISNCFSVGNVGENGGGICGSHFGAYMSGKTTIQNCYSIGDIGNNGGGICGSYYGYYNMNNTTIENCYSTGNIGNYGGGICGSYYANRKISLSYIKNCYSTGLVGVEGGGICGSYFGSDNNANGSVTIRIQNSYTTGKVGNGGGGICGSYYNSLGLIIIQNCTFHGEKWHGSNEIIGYNTQITKLISSSDGWKKEYADSESGLTGINTIWYKFHDENREIDKPYLLASFNNELYSPNKKYYMYEENGYSTDAIPRADSTIDKFSIMSVNNSNIPSGMTIEFSTGKLTFNNVKKPLTGKHNIRVVGGYQKNSEIYYGYNIGNYFYSTDIKINQENIANYSWPFIINEGVNVTFIDDLILNSQNHYFIIKNNGVKINGQNKTIIIENVTDYPGLFQNGTANENGYGNIEIKNIGVLSNKSSLQKNGGWICQSDFGNSISTDMKIFNCYSTGNIGENGGGICGSNFGINISGTVTIENCYSTGDILYQGGGICGSQFGNNMSGSAIIQNCYSVGNILDFGNGGICGINFGYQMRITGNVTIKNCYSTGNIGQFSGGICGYGVGSQMSGTAIIQNCYSVGSVASYGGGICGSNFGNQMSGTTIIQNCAFYSNNWFGDFSQNIPSNTPNLINNQTSGWLNSLADSIITDINTVWYKFYDTNGEINTPYLLASFNSQLYSPNFGNYVYGKIGTSNNAIPRFDSENDKFIIMSVNDINSPNGISIESKTGQLTFDNITYSLSKQYNIRVVGGYQKNSVFYGYDINNYLYKPPIEITQEYVDNDSNWPVKINKGELVIFSENLIINSISKYFIIMSSDITIDGQNHTITINDYIDYPGLIKNGDENENGYGNINIKNIGLSFITLAKMGGAICQKYFANGVSTNIEISNCYSAGYINNKGGICGNYFGYQMSGKTIIKNCYFTGSSINDGSGGICGPYFGYEMTGSAVIENCFSTSYIDRNCGGICGEYFGDSMSGTIIIKNCYSTGKIFNTGGGICGVYFANNISETANLIIQNCYSTGSIGNFGGGILSQTSAKLIKGNLTIENCYSTGNIGETGGGICGGNFGESISPTGKVTIQNCYSTGIVANNGGGICGAEFGYEMSGKFIIKNCTFYGQNWYGSDSQNLPSDTPNLINNQNNGWQNIIADSPSGLTGLTGLNKVWSKFYDNSGELNKPYLLASFNRELYSPNSIDYYYGEITTSNNAISKSDSNNDIFTIMSANDTIISNRITIDSGTGKLTFNDTTKSLSGTYIIKVVGGYQNSGVYYGYDISNYTANGLAPCFKGDVNVYMADGTIKKIKDIQRGDIVLEDIKTGKTNVVARLYSAFSVINDVYFIKKGLIGNNEDITCTNHPIWCNNGKNRVFPADIEGVEKIKYSDYIYDVQFEDDTTFYVNGIKVDSLPPYNNVARLPKNLYFDESKYSDHQYINEDDPIRNKPPMTKDVYNFNT
jgi:hypothetical protein